MNERTCQKNAKRNEHMNGMLAINKSRKEKSEKSLAKH